MNGDVFDRTPPFSVEAETMVLGALFIDRDAITRVIPKVREADFYREANRRVYRAAIELWERGTAVDPVTVAEKLKASGEFDAAGGFDYIGALMEAVPSARNVEHHAEIVAEKAMMRRVVERATKVIREVYDGGDPTAVAAEIERLSEAIAWREGGDFTWVKERLWSTFEHIEQMQEAGGGTAGVPSGFPDVDRLTNGFAPGDLVVLAARPSMGKSAFLTDVVRSASIGGGMPTAIASLEMTSESLISRMLCAEGRIDSQRLRRGELNEEEHQRLAAAAGHLNSAPIYIDEFPGRTLAEVAAKITRLKRRVDIRLAAIDYLQLMQGSGEENRVQEINAITSGLKQLALRQHIPLLLLSQLSRGPENRSDHRPMLSDLRDSGGIEQDADIVMFLYRSEYYAAPGKRDELKGKAELIVAKHRNGPTGVVPLYWQESYTRFDSLERSW